MSRRYHLLPASRRLLGLLPVGQGEAAAFNRQLVMWWVALLYGGKCSGGTTACSGVVDRRRVTSQVRLR